ncbi:MAG: glycosyltransferase [Burkholderiaceae bacterium]
MKIADGGAAPGHRAPSEPDMPVEAPRMALVMIVRDEARCIQRCLDSVRPWVDEMLVLDTGSRDATVAIAQRCGAVVKPFAWIDDFAAARNAALALTQAPWRLVLDADEWLVGGGDQLAAVRSQDPTFLGQVRVASRIDHGATDAPSWLPRLLPAGTRYAGRIHEQPESPLPRRRIALDIAHDGYLAAQRVGKAGRNRRLLETALAEQPDDAYWNYQLGKDLEVNSQFVQARPHYAHAYASAAANASWRHDLVVRWMFTLKQLGCVDDALRVAAAEQARWADSPDFHFTLGDVLLECAIRQPQHAATLLPQIEASWLRALQLGERPDLPDSVQGRGSYLAAHNLAVFHASLGHVDTARHWEQRALRLRESATAQPEVVG